MRLYTVLAPTGRPDDAPDPLSLVFVKEGFCWPALFFPEIWLIFRRLWLVWSSSSIIAAVALLTLFADRAPGPLPWTAARPRPLFFALEGNDLRRWTWTGTAIG